MKQLLNRALKMFCWRTVYQVRSSRSRVYLDDGDELLGVREGDAMDGLAWGRVVVLEHAIALGDRA